MIFGEGCQYFAVNKNVLLFERAHKLTVRHAFFGQSGANLNIPQSSEVTFFVSSMSKGVSAGVKNGFLGLFLLFTSAEAVTFYLPQCISSGFESVNSFLYSCHIYYFELRNSFLGRGFVGHGGFFFLKNLFFPPALPPGSPKHPPPPSFLFFFFLKNKKKKTWGGGGFWENAARAGGAERVFLKKKTPVPQKPPAEKRVS